MKEIARQKLKEIPEYGYTYTSVKIILACIRLVQFWILQSLAQLVGIEQEQDHLHSVFKGSETIGMPKYHLLSGCTLVQDSTLGKKGLGNALVVLGIIMVSFLLPPRLRADRGRWRY